MKSAVKCILCGKPRVIVEQQGPLCKDCFIRYFQKKVFRTIRKYRLFNKKDRLCVACSGGKDSLAALYLVNRIAKKQRQPIFALGIDEGIEGYRDKQLTDMLRFCEKHKIDAVTVSFREEFGQTIEELMKTARRKKLGVSRCALCGMLRRRLLNRHARKLGATKIVVGHNLDDEAETVMMNVFKGGIELMARMGPGTGVVKHKGFVQRIKPFYFCTDEETRLYTKLMGFRVLYRRCPYRRYSYRNFISEKIGEVEKHYKGTKTSIIQNVLQILPLLKRQFSSGKIPECRHCGEPARGRVCNVCDILNRLGIKRI